MKQKETKSELKEALQAVSPFFKRGMAFTVVANFLSLAPIGYMQDVYGSVINSRSHQTLVMVTLLLIGALLLSGLLEWVRGRMCAAAAVEFARKVGPRVFDASFQANLKQQQGAHNALHDLRAIRNFMASHATGVLMDAPISLIFLFLVFFINPRMGVIATLGAIAMFMIGIRTERRVQPMLSKAQMASLEAQHYATNSVRNAQVVEALGMMKNIEQRWQPIQERFLIGQGIASDRQAGSSAASKFVMMMQGSAILGVGCWLTIEGIIANGGVAMIIGSILGARAIQPLVQLISTWKQVVMVRDSFERLDAFLAAVPASSPGMSMPPPNGALTLENVSAQVPVTRRTILQEISCQVDPGEILVIIGPSGSGKSTLARLLVGVWPASVGSVRLAGVDVYAWNKDELGPYVGYLPQDIELFDGTLAENIARFGEIDRQLLEQAGRQVGLHDMIMTLPNGYDTQIGDDGCIFSGGQRQRIGLARAIYGNPRLVVLDEPNSSLDEAGDKALMETIQMLKTSGCVVVIISHRKSVLPLVDQILVLLNGRTKFYGPRDQVLAKIMGKPAQAKTATTQIADVSRGASVGAAS